MSLKRYSELGGPADLVKPADPLEKLMDGLDSGWYLVDRMVFGSFVGVMSNAGRNRKGVWVGLRNCWDHMLAMDAEFCKLMETGECAGADVLLSKCTGFVNEVDKFGPELNPLGMAIATAYLAKVPTCWVEHLDVMARARILAVDLTGGPSFEYAERLLGLHRQKLKVLQLKLEKTVFHLNSKMMNSLDARTIAAVAIFTAHAEGDGDIKSALAHVAGRYNLPIEML